MQKNNFWDNSIPIGYYDLSHNGTNNSSKIQSNWHHISYTRVAKYLKKNINHLDYACGPGTLIGLYSQSNSIGYDYAKLQIEYANNKYKNYDSEFTFDEKKIFNRKYDVITIMGLFEYLEDIEILNLLNKFKDSLSKNGKIIITTPNYNSFIRILEMISNSFGSVNYSKVNINKLTKKRLLQIISKTDYKINKIQKFLNFGVLFSVFSLKTGIKVENFISNIFNNFFGYLMFVEIEINDYLFESNQA